MSPDHLTKFGGYISRKFVSATNKKTTYPWIVNNVRIYSSHKYRTFITRSCFRHVLYFRTVHNYTDMQIFPLISSRWVLHFLISYYDIELSSELPVSKDRFYQYRPLHSKSENNGFDKHSRNVSNPFGPWKDRAKTKLK